ncbi:hypothetical protein JXB01_01895, partial [Candidatus Micrarchaeota archaeon]|nr:hypothetical protein [Candidatus Micrarchaeota archaeon]
PPNSKNLIRIKLVLKGNATFEDAEKIMERIPHLEFEAERRNNAYGVCEFFGEPKNIVRAIKFIQSPEIKIIAEKNPAAYGRVMNLLEGFIKSVKIPGIILKENNL